VFNHEEYKVQGIEIFTNKEEGNKRRDKP